MLKNSINATVIEADYQQFGKMISEAIKALRDDVDIVYFLDDDDMFYKDKIEYINKIFEKRRDIVTIHNSRKFIDLNYELDKIPFEIEIRKDNDDFVQLVRENYLLLTNKGDSGLLCKL